MRDGGHGRSRTCILSSVYGSPVRSRRRLRAHDARLAPVAGFEPAAAWLTARSTHPVRLTGMIWWTDRVLPPAPVACKASVQPSARPKWCLVVVSSHALRVFGAALSPDQLTRRIGADIGNRNRDVGVALRCLTFKLCPRGKWTESNLLPIGTAFTAQRRHQPVLIGTSQDWLQRSDSNGRPSGYGPDELPLLHAARKEWPSRGGSNTQPQASDACALPLELRDEIGAPCGERSRLTCSTGRPLHLMRNGAGNGVHPGTRTRTERALNATPLPLG